MNHVSDHDDLQIDFASSPTLSKIRDVAGIAAARALIKERGGAAISIPSDVKNPGTLGDIVGTEAASRIIEAFRGVGYLRIPTGKGLGSNRRISRERVHQLMRPRSPTEWKSRATATPIP
ncbi:hypothetical protein WCLP8_4870006 [uncultured Gammaproteobacteria bacterium]